MLNRRSSLDDSSLESAVTRRRTRISIAPKHDVIPEDDVNRDVIRSRSSLLVRLESGENVATCLTDGPGDFSFKPAPDYDGEGAIRHGALRSAADAAPRQGAIQRCSSVDSLLHLGLRILEESLKDPPGEPPSGSSDPFLEEDGGKDSDDDVMDFDASETCDVILLTDDDCDNVDRESPKQMSPTSQCAPVTSPDDVTPCNKCAILLREVALSNQKLLLETRRLRDDVTFLEQVMRKVIKHVGFGNPPGNSQEEPSSPPSMRYTIDNLGSVTEEAILEKLLYEAEEFEDRRKIRRAIRELRSKKLENGGNKKENQIKTWSTTKSASSTSTRALPNGSIKKESSETTASSAYIRKTRTPLDGKKEQNTKSLSDKYSGSSYTSTRKEMSSSSTKKVGSIFDREEEAPKRLQVDKRREVMRNRSMPASSAKDARKMFVAMDGNTGNKAVGRKVGRSPTSVVPNANNIKQMLLKWCQAKTRGYEHVDITNFSGSWANGMAFCALVHNFFPEAFDYASLDPKNRPKNFQLAFDAAEKLGEIPALLDTEDMVRMAEPDWKCVYTYITEFYKRIRELQLS